MTPADADDLERAMRKRIENQSARDPLVDEFNKKHRALDEAQDYQGIAALGKQAEDAGLVWDGDAGEYRRADG